MTSPIRRSPKTAVALLSSQRSFLDRHRLHVVLGEVNVYEFREGEAARDPLLAADSVELTVQRVNCVLLADETPALDPLRAAPTGPVSICPLRLPVSTAPFQLEYLTLLNHYRFPS